MARIDHPEGVTGDGFIPCNDHRSLLRMDNWQRAHEIAWRCPDCQAWQ